MPWERGRLASSRGRLSLRRAVPVKTLTGKLGTAVVDSKDCRYRYHLTRNIGKGEGAVAFVMLNPSTANESQDDRTVGRCIGFAQKWGFQTLEVGNLYAWYATDPTELLDAPLETGR